MGEAVFQLFIWVLFGWAGLVVLVPLVMKASGSKNAISGFLLALIIPPLAVLVWIQTEAIVRNKQSQEALDKSDPGWGTYKEVCKNRKINVHFKESGKTPRGILVIPTEFYRGRAEDMDARMLASCALSGSISKSLSGCIKSNINFVEEQKHLVYLRYSNDSNDGPVQAPSADVVSLNSKIVDKASSQYALLLGKSGDQEKIQVQENLAIEKSSIQLIRRIDGKVLADTSIYFMRQKSGIYGCPNALAEASKMLKSVFGAKREMD